MDAEDRVPGNPERQAARLLSQPVPGRLGQLPRRRDHAVRIHRRAPRFPVLGRAGAQGELQSHPGHRRAPDCHLQRRAGERAQARGRKEGGRLQGDDFDVHLPGRVHRRRVRRDRAGRCGHAAQDRSRPRQTAADHMGAADRRVLAQIFRRVLWAQVSRRQARPDRDPRFRLGRDGKSGRDHLSRDRAARRREIRVARRTRARRRRGLARKRAHVVRRSGHHAMVERHLAQRGVRHLHGDAGR